MEINKSEINKSPRRLGCFAKLLIAAGVVLAAFALLVGVAGYLWFSWPDYYKPVEVTPDLKHRAEEIEARITAALTAEHPYGEPWTLTVTQEEANTWIAGRLPDWLLNRGAEPRSVELVRGAVVAVQGDHVEAAKELEIAGVKQVIRALYRPVESADGRPVRMQLAGIMGGKLPIPLDRVLAEVRAHYRPANETAGRLFDSATVHVKSIPLDLPLGDGRDVQVNRMEFRGETVELTLQTNFTPRPKTRRK